MSSAPVPLALIRHGVTDWNAAGYLQGRRDVPLSAAGRSAVAGWSVPAEFAAWRWVASPLSRARDTAAALHTGSVHTDPRLLEFDWGEWEGPAGAAKRAATPGRDPITGIRDGLDRRAPGGETMRDVQHRLRPWLHDVARAAVPTVAITHKGVILAIYALATGWDLTTPPPDTLAWQHAHMFFVGPDGGPIIDRLNIAL